MAANLRPGGRPDKAFATAFPWNYFMPSQATMWQNMSMARLWFRCGLAVFLLALAGNALAMPRLERERCTFKPPRGNRVECFVLVVPENREQPEGREVRLKVAVLKARRPANAEPLFY
ncbi:MAG TPA: hypothetical protein VFV87_20190, partial [Pirellulaceae bacterium]|nr:hypothetical protein [Pirellulaceae bacterium]